MRLNNFNNKKFTKTLKKTNFSCKIIYSNTKFSKNYLSLVSKFCLKIRNLLKCLNCKIILKIFKLEFSINNFIFEFQIIIYIFIIFPYGNSFSNSKISVFLLILNIRKYFKYSFLNHYFSNFYIFLLKKKLESRH